MKLAIFGLTVSSSWGNGHATIWRGLCGALAKDGHHVTFFERDVSYYANHRDLDDPEGYSLVLYETWDAVKTKAEETLANADVGIVTSYCPDAGPASYLVLDSPNVVRVFYDLDSPVTLERLSRGEKVDYIQPYGLQPFDLVLSYAGGRAIDQLKSQLGARHVQPLYGSADPNFYRAVAPNNHYQSDMSYLGTYSSDRQDVLEELLLEPARRYPNGRFVLGGAQYPEDFPWTENIWFVRHVPPPCHPAFYSSSRMTLNVTRAAMANCGYAPSGRLFEAAACGTPVISDSWDGLEQFFEPRREILVARNAGDVIEALQMDAEDLRRIGARARERVLEEHTAEKRSRQLLQALEVYA
jgi:spore maturation protein CgeB